MRKDEVVQAREERLVLERLRDKGIHFLLERQVHANADGAAPLGSTCCGGSFVGGLHQAGAAAGDDVTAHLGQSGCNPFHLVIRKGPRPGAGRAEDRDPVALALRGAQPGEVVDDLPQAEDRAHEDFLDVLLVREADGPRTWPGWFFCGHDWFLRYGFLALA